MGIFFSIEFGILSSPGVLLLARYFRHRLYVSWSKYVYLEMAFLIHSFVYLVVIFLACIFDVLANVASSFI